MKKKRKKFLKKEKNQFKKKIKKKQEGRKKKVKNKNKNGEGGGGGRKAGRQVYPLPRHRSHFPTGGGGVLGRAGPGRAGPTHARTHTERNARTNE